MVNVPRLTTSVPSVKHFGDVWGLLQPGMDVEGIYRLAGSSRQIDALKMQFQYGRSVHPPHAFGDTCLSPMAVANT